MALINCPDCNKEVSTEAKICPNCGRPIATVNEEGKKKFSSFGFWGLGILGVAFLYLMSNPLQHMNLFFFLAGITLIMCGIDIFVRRKRYNIVPSIISVVISILVLIDLFV